MIKVGDKVFCIKDFENSHQKFIAGKLYEIHHNIKERETYVLGEFKHEFGNGYWFYGNFSEYFTTLAEFREQQIKTILDG